MRFCEADVFFIMHINFFLYIHTCLLACYTCLVFVLQEEIELTQRKILQQISRIASCGSDKPYPRLLVFDFMSDLSKLHASVFH